MNFSKKIFIKVLFSFFLVILFTSCSKSDKKKSKKTIEKLVSKNNYPKELSNVFEKHGGIDLWRKAQTLSFNKGEEVHTIALHSRKTVINTPNYSLGFNGKNVWLDEEEKGSYKRNPSFYYNLFFYFYAMPFVLADDGIVYEKTASIIFEGKEYPGYKISYKANVGTSPDDNYIIYYNSKTYQMEWLAYTVTFKSKKPSDSYNIIKYDKWENVSGLLFPKEITWYKKDDKGNPDSTSGKPVEFTSPLISEAQYADSFYEKPRE